MSSTTIQAFKRDATSRTGNFEAVLPKGMDAAHFAMGLVTAAAKNSALLKCDPQEVFACAYSIAATGLELDPAMQQAYIIPYGNTPTVVIDYRGLIELALRSGKVLSFHSDVVREGETFEHWTDESGPHLKHVPKFGGRNALPLAGAYAIAQLVGGGQVMAVMDDSEIDRIKKSGVPWKQHAAEMWKKTAIRRCFKLCPKDSAMRRAVSLVDAEMAWEAQSRRPAATGSAEAYIASRLPALELAKEPTQAPQERGNGHEAAPGQGGADNTAQGEDSPFHGEE